MALTAPQLEILHALIKLCNAREGRGVRSSELARYLGKHEVSVRRILSVMKGLGLVQSRVGPGGGYLPTLKAFELVKSPPIPIDMGSLRLVKDGTRTEITAIEIDLLDVSGATGYRAIIRAVGNFSEIKTGDHIRVGPTAFGRLVVEGKVLRIDRENGEILVDVATMFSVPKLRVGDVMSKDLITINPDRTVEEAAEILHKHDIRALPVVEGEKAVGIILSKDILHFLAKGRGKEKVGNVARRDYFTVLEESDVTEAMVKMIKHKTGRLIVVDRDGRPIGIVTRTDLLSKFAEAFQQLD
ncbi:MAG: CBS domain-containing protein [Candidatus Methanodesulfokora sp.]|jgi:predicted transcriptional regulator